MTVDVYMAIGTGPNNRGRVRYYETPGEIPEGYQATDPPTRDISDIMEANGWSKETTLQMMNY